MNMRKVYHKLGKLKDLAKGNPIYDKVKGVALKCLKGHNLHGYMACKKAILRNM